jgi:hypothetical protein
MIPSGASLMTHVTILDTASEKLVINVLVDSGALFKANPRTIAQAKIPI